MFQAQALQHCRLYQIPASVLPPKRTVLGFMLPGKLNANTPAEFLTEQSDIDPCCCCLCGPACRCRPFPRMMPPLC